MPKPLKIAAICTQYYPLSHADVIVTRWLDPHPHDAEVGFAPASHITSLHVVQKPQGNPPVEDGFQLSPRRRDERYNPKFDISELVSQTYGVPLYPSIRDALTLGKDELAVDAVLLIGEHGDYPLNALGQKLYPRKELFEAIIAVFEEFEQVVPLFCDKHLSWNKAWAQDMVDTVHRLDIPFFSGSSIPITGPAQPLNILPQADIPESMGLFFTGAETYGIHSMEYVQSIIETRRGGESGIAAITAYQGDGVWQAMGTGRWSQDLFEATLAACPSRKAGDYRQNCQASPLTPVACVAEHLDGHQQTHIMLDGHIRDFTVGLKLGDGSPPRASACASDTGKAKVFVNNFAHLCRALEAFFQSGQAPVPVERNLLTTLEIATFMQALQTPGERILTPDLHIAY